MFVIFFFDFCRTGSTSDARKNEKGNDFRTTRVNSITEAKIFDFVIYEIFNVVDTIAKMNENAESYEGVRAGQYANFFRKETFFTSGVFECIEYVCRVSYEENLPLKF